LYFSVDPLVSEEANKEKNILNELIVQDLELEKINKLEISQKETSSKSTIEISHQKMVDSNLIEKKIEVQKSSPSIKERGGSFLG
jgi:hypothetical protein